MRFRDFFGSFRQCWLASFPQNDTVRQMASPEFLDFLQKRKEAARLDFLEAKRQLEDFEIEWGSAVYVGQWEKQDQKLSAMAAKAYAAYKKAWVEWYAAANGYALQGPPGGHKDTPAFASPIATRHLRVRIRPGEPSLAKGE